MSIQRGSKEKWIEKGYEHFALHGPENISINKISKEIDSPRACFYHHFGDIEIFIDILLEMHWELHENYTKVAARECKKYLPDFYLFLAQFPIPIRFSRQLFINRNNPTYNYLFIKTYNAGASSFLLKLFSDQYGLKNDNDTYNLWLTVGEAWYSRLDVNNLTATHMQQLAEEVLNSVLKFVSTDLYSKMKRNALAK